MLLNLSRCQLADGKPDVIRNTGLQLCQLPQNDTIQQIILDENCFTGECIHVYTTWVYAFVSKHEISHLQEMWHQLK